MIRQWVARPPRALPTHGGRDFATATAQAHCGARLAQRGAGGAACWEAARWRALRVYPRRRAPPPSESCARTRGTPSWRPLGCSSPTRTTSCGILMKKNTDRFEMEIQRFPRGCCPSGEQLSVCLRWDFRREKLTWFSLRRHLLSNYVKSEI